MGNVSKELLRECIKEQNFSNANEILVGLKEMFRDVLQESLEAEMDEALGYGKYDSIKKTMIIFAMDIQKRLLKQNSDLYS